MDEFKAFSDSRHVKVAILDLEKPVTGRTCLSWKNGTITGKADVDKTIDVKTKLTAKVDKACSAGKGEKPSCHFIEDGDKFYEVRDDLKVHADRRVRFQASTAPTPHRDSFGCSSLRQLPDGKPPAMVAQ
ncbi:hypothetical protein [Rhizobium bangladeshense]|uniref:hypothetical protein n=1 Tax=Rhizobium bangladeshense TaxID=1138189 RepID=UPI001FEF6A3D|nr:hypothetical protein [Rhizobium bangladeshense]